MERVVAGLVKNVHLGGPKILQLTFATLRASLSRKDKKKLKKGGKKKKRKKNDDNDNDSDNSESDIELDDDDFEELEMAINISSGRKGKMKSSSKKLETINKSIDNKKNDQNNVMFSSSTAVVHSVSSAITSKKRQRHEDAKVQDGANAPKLTGWGRFGLTGYNNGNIKDDGNNNNNSNNSNNTVEHVALAFALDLLASSLKKNKVTKEHTQLLNPFLFVLTSLTSASNEDVVIATAIHSLQILLKMNTLDTAKTAKVRRPSERSERGRSNTRRAPLGPFEHPVVGITWCDVIATRGRNYYSYC